MRKATKDPTREKPVTAVSSCGKLQDTLVWRQREGRELAVEVPENSSVEANDPFPHYQFLWARVEGWRGQTRAYLSPSWVSSFASFFTFRCQTLDFRCLKQHGKARLEILDASGLSYMFRDPTNPHSVHYTHSLHSNAISIILFFI